MYVQLYSSSSGCGLTAWHCCIPSTFQYMKSGTNRTHQFKKYEYHYNVMNIIKIMMKSLNWKDATLLEVEDAYGGWLGPLSAILQFQLPLYFHPISTLFPLWTLTSTLFPLYFHSTSILFPLHFHPSTILLRIGGGGCRVPHHWLVGRVCGPLTLKPIVGPRIFLEHQSAGCRGSAIAS